MKTPIIADNMWNCSNLTAITKGTANKRYRRSIENREMKKVFLLDRPSLRGSVSPMRMKLTTLKRVPNIRPFPREFWPIKKVLKPMMTAIARALEPYFFCVRLIDSILPSFLVFLLVTDDLHDLPVNDVSTTDNAQYNKYGDENPLGVQPLIEFETDKKTKGNAPRHCQPDLHDDGQVFGPWAIFLVVETH